MSSPACPRPLPRQRLAQRRYADCHMHTVLCGHAEHSIEEMVSTLEESSLKGGIITEHLPLPKHVDSDRVVSMHRCELPSYVSTLQVLRDRSPLGENLVIGAEADWRDVDPQWTVRSVESARAAGVEVVLGSVHMLGNWAFDDPGRIDVWDSKNVDAVWEQYFTEWGRAAASGLFDVMAHPDLVKKFGHLPKDPGIYYAEAARLAAESGVLCEVSTAGLRKPCAELYPSPLFLKELARRGVNFTLASDAHDKADIGYRFDLSAQALLSVGVTRQAFPKAAGRIDYLPLA